MPFKPNEEPLKQGERAMKTKAFNYLELMA